MSGPDFFFQAFVYLAAAVVSVPIAARLGFGSVLGYLLAGIVIGPFGLALVGSEGEDVLHFAEFGVVMMLFVIGLELRPALLWRLRGALLGLGGLQVLLTSAAFAAGGIALGLPARSAVAVGLVLSLSSTAIVLQSLSERKLLKTEAGERSFAVLLFQDLAVIPMLAILPLLALGGPDGDASGHGHAAGWLEALPAWGRAVVPLAAVAGVVAIGRFGVGPLLGFIARGGAREAFTAAALLLVIGIALLMQQVGLSPALGTFLGGVVLAGSEYRHELEADVEPFKGLLLGLFFIAVGASIDFGLVGGSAGLVGGLVVAIVAVKAAVLLVLARAARMGLDAGLLFALALAQGGEFCFVLFSFATQNGVLPPGLANVLVAGVALSMAVTPFLLLLHERVLRPRLGTREAPGRAPDALQEEGAVIVAGFGAFGSIAGRMLRANGVSTTVLDTDADHVDLLRSLGLEVHYGDASREDLLRAAGAERARVLIVATDEPEGTLSLVRTARRRFPHLRVLVRAHHRTEAYDLLEAGADEVYRESLDTALRMAADTLHALGDRAYRAHRAALAFRRHDEAQLRALARVRHDEALFASRARESIRVLEEIMREECSTRAGVDDSAWDAEGLRREFGGTTGDGTGPAEGRIPREDGGAPTR